MVDFAQTTYHQLLNQLECYMLDKMWEKVTLSLCSILYHCGFTSFDDLTVHCLVFENVITN